MPRDRNYKSAEAQVEERIAEARVSLAFALGEMDMRRPGEALDALSKAKDAIEGAMTTAKWAVTLPVPEDD